VCLQDEKEKSLGSAGGARPQSTEPISGAGQKQALLRENRYGPQAIVGYI
jgi:hypothetical protein